MTLFPCRDRPGVLYVCRGFARQKLPSCYTGEPSHAASFCHMRVRVLLPHARLRHRRASCLHRGRSEVYATLVLIWRSRFVELSIKFRSVRAILYKYSYFSLVCSCSITGSIRDDPYWTSRENSLELIELPSINIISLVLV